MIFLSIYKYNSHTPSPSQPTLCKEHYVLSPVLQKLLCVPFLNPLSRTRLHSLSQILSKDLFSTQKLKIMKLSSNADITPFAPSISFRSSMPMAFEKDDISSPIRNDCMMRCHRGS